jgi:26S proteasome regulatory subunit T6
MTIAVQAPTPVGGIKSYYQTKIEAAELLINQKTQNLRRLEAQRNALNARGGSSVSASILTALSAYSYRDI